MATDSERRRVAERMRASADKYDFCASNIALDMGIVGSDYSEGYNARHRLAWLRLADLVEPDCDEDRKDFQPNDTCDRGALLALADEMASFSRDVGCPSCAASGQPECSCGVECRVSISHSAARRIREACGDARGGA